MENRQDVCGTERKTMFDMRRIGRKISDLRKAKNMTQMALADALGISFQAVSNWERGESMPDIAKLGELSEIFDCSIDEILCNTRAAEIVMELSSGEPASDLTTAELVDAAPILPPAQLEVCAKEQTVSITLSSVVSLAPFLNSETLAELAQSKVNEGCTVEELALLAPFLDEADLGKILHQKLDSCTAGELAGVAPFLSEEDLADLAMTKLKGGCSLQELTGLAPFLSDEALAGLARTKLQAGGSLDELSALAPFLDERTLGELVKKLLSE